MSNRTVTRLTDHVLFGIGRELERARAAHPKPLNSAHEAYAVILEEMSEFWVEVCKKRAERNALAMLNELVQVAAMAVRAIEDLGLLTYSPAAAPDARGGAEDAEKKGE